VRPVGAHVYSEGTVVDISATANPGYRFLNWTGDVADPNSPATTVTMDAAKEVTANFEVVPTYTLTMAVNPVGGGTTDPAVGAHVYSEGTVVDISAIANAGYRFINWTGDVADPNSPTTTVTMDDNKTVTANFGPPPHYTLTMAVNPVGGGTTDPTVGAHEYPEGTVVDISATPNPGYQFLNWTGDVVDPSSPTTTVTMDADKGVTANFEEITAFIISGYVLEADPNPIKKVKMFLTGDATDTTCTDRHGYYEFTDLPKGYYKVEPYKEGWKFEPKYRKYRPLTSNMTDQNYEGTRVFPPPVADFKGEPRQGVAPLTVQFTDLSVGEITEWHWEFGDGETSYEKNPKHTYDPPFDPKYTVSLTVTGPGGSDKETKTGYITVYIPVQANFDAAPTVGPAPLTVKFTNTSSGSFYNCTWDFGDGATSSVENPSHTYDTPGSYTVKLKAEGPGGKDCEEKVDLITVYDPTTGYAYLELIESSQTHPGEGWDNAIDGDTYGWDGTVTAEGNKSYAIFGFADSSSKDIEKVRLMIDTGVGFENRWAKRFHVQVSTTGLLEADFNTVLEAQKVGGDWEDYKFAPVSAKYIKLIIDEPIGEWQQVGEFEVYEHIILADASKSTIVATSPHYANGLDQSTITMVLADSAGVPVTGKTSVDFRMYATGSNNIFGTVVETATPGTYTTTLASFTSGEKTVWAVVNGVKIQYTAIGDTTLATALFLAPPSTMTSMKLIDHSYAYPGEGWDNAIDGDLEGWDGTVTAGDGKSPKPYAIFGFDDSETKIIHKVRLMTDTGVGDGWAKYRWVKKFLVQVSTTGIEEDDFKTILDANKQGGNWEEFFFIADSAKYVKLVIIEPHDGWRQLGEFEVYETSLILMAKSTIAAVENNELVGSPETYSLSPNYPNPFNPETFIQYQLPEPSKVTIKIYNMMGQEIKVLVDAEKDAGHFTVRWDGKDNIGRTVASGIYLFRIEAYGENQKGFVETRRMTLLK